MAEQPATGPSAKALFPPSHIIRQPQPKPNILPLLILQQRSLFKTLSCGFEKLQRLTNDRNYPEQQGLEEASIALAELSDSVHVIRRRMDALIWMASDAGYIDLADTNELEGGEISPLIQPSRRAGEPEINFIRNFSRPFDRTRDANLQDCGCGTACAATILASRGGDMSPALPSPGNHTGPPRTPQKGRLQGSGDPEHNRTSIILAHQAPSPPNAPSAQGGGRPLAAPPRVSVLINSPLESTNIRKQVKLASRARDPCFNEVRRISVLGTGVVRTTYYQAEPTDAEIPAAGENKNPLSSESINTQRVDRLGVVGRMGRMVRHKRGFLSLKSVGKLLR